MQEEDLQAEEQPEAGAGAAGDPAAQGTDQWVQCDRCKTWRIVPDSDWGAVQVGCSPPKHKNIGDRSIDSGEVPNKKHDKTAVMYE